MFSLPTRSINCQLIKCCFVWKLKTYKKGGSDFSPHDTKTSSNSFSIDGKSLAVVKSFHCKHYKLQLNSCAILRSILLQREIESRDLRELLQLMKIQIYDARTTRSLQWVLLAFLIESGSDHFKFFYRSGVEFIHEFMSFQMELDLESVFVRSPWVGLCVHLGRGREVNLVWSAEAVDRGQYKADL